MPNSSNTKGRAYEYAVIQSLKDKVTGKVEPKIIENSSLQANARAWNSLEPEDYYKIISKDSDKVTLIETFNMNATLNRDAAEKKAALVTPQIVIPSELIAIRLRKGSKTTVDMYMDGGWQFSFRLHNASTKVEPSLKFNINFQGLPPEVMTYKISWNKSGKEI